MLLCVIDMHVLLSIDSVLHMKMWVSFPKMLPISNNTIISYQTWINETCCKFPMYFQLPTGELFTITLVSLLDYWVFFACNWQCINFDYSYCNGDRVKH